MDTNVLSELKRKIPNIKVLKWFETVATEQLYISCLTVGEVTKGILLKAKTDVTSSVVLANWLDKILESFSDNILNIDLVTCRKWGELLAINGTNHIDALIAAQALVHDMTLVTRTQSISFHIIYIYLTPLNKKLWSHFLVK